MVEQVEPGVKVVAVTVDPLQYSLFTFGVNTQVVNEVLEGIVDEAW